jgi:hypothetical protein
VGVDCAAVSLPVTVTQPTNALVIATKVNNFVMGKMTVK